MKVLEKECEAKGFEVVNWGYPSRSKMIEAHAKDLVQALQIQSKKHPEKPIHFITHSLGGIIVRAALNDPDCPDEAKLGKAVLMAPPNQGSAFGRALGKVDAMQKILGSHTGQELTSAQNFDHIGQFPDTKKVLIISGTFGWNPLILGKNDGKVGVKESCLDTFHYHCRVFAGHSWIMYNHTACHTAVDFLTKAKEQNHDNNAKEFAGNPSNVDRR